MKKTIYKSLESKEVVQRLYDEQLQKLDFQFEEIDVPTAFGRTRVIKTGNENGEKIVLFHGIHAGAPLTLRAVKGLRNRYQLFAIDTVGQATRSEETLIDIKDDSFAIWADEVLQHLAIENANCVGISYGAFILQKLITHKAERVKKSIFIVPSGMANGAFWPSLTKLTIPLIRFHITKKDDDLRKFIEPFVYKDDLYMLRFQKAILLGVHMDYRRPSILKVEDVSHFTKPVYLIVADLDIFFPAERTITKALEVFVNLKEIHVLKDCKHMPHENDFPEIERKITEWVG